MLLSDYLNIPKLKSVELTAKTSKEKFLESMYKAYDILFGGVPHPVVLSNEKYFNRSPVLADVELNKKGLHLFRYVFSTYAARHRCDRPEFLDDGLVMIEDFLDKDWHELLLQEIETVPCAVNKQPYNLATNLMGTHPAVNYTVFSSGMRQIVQGCVGSHKRNAQVEYREKSYVQRVQNSPEDNDIQKKIHSDIFSPAIKWWYFPEEVRKDYGPFRYQSGPKAITGQFLQWLHEQSVNICEGKVEEWRGIDHVEGSLRLTEEEAEKLGFSIDQVPVKANTLVFANVQHFHCRGDTKEPITRSAIHGSIRIEDPLIL